MVLALLSLLRKSQPQHGLATMAIKEPVCGSKQSNSKAKVIERLMENGVFNFCNSRAIEQRDHLHLAMVRG